MDKSGIAVHHIWPALLILAGSVLFLWFCWPAVFKGILNIGNLCGMLGSAALVFYGIRCRAVHQLIARLWQVKTGRVCLVTALVLAAAAAVLMIMAAAAILRAASPSIPPDTPAVVLGCSVKGTKPSTILKERIDAACAYLQEHPQAVCILSGGRGPGEDISEAACMYRSLVDAGVDAGRLYQEDQSVNTKENLENSKKILDKLGITGSVAVISSEFHLYRGRQQAQALGYESYGYAAHTDWRYLPAFFLREIIAVVHFWLT